MVSLSSSKSSLLGIPSLSVSVDALKLTESEVLNAFKGSLEKKVAVLLPIQFSLNITVNSTVIIPSAPKTPDKPSNKFIELYV